MAPNHMDAFKVEFGKILNSGVIYRLDCPSGFQ